MDVNTQINHVGGGVSQGHETSRSKPTMKEVQAEVEKTQQKSNQQELKKELQQIATDLNKEMRSLNSTLKFGFNEKADTFYVSVIDTKTDKEIRRFPTDEALELMSKMREVVGQIFDTKG